MEKIDSLYLGPKGKKKVKNKCTNKNLTGKKKKEEDKNHIGTWETDLTSQNTHRMRSNQIIKERKVNNIYIQAETSQIWGIT